MFISLYVSTRFFYFYTINFNIPRTCIRIDKNIFIIQIRTLHNILSLYFFTKINITVDVLKKNYFVLFNFVFLEFRYLANWYFIMLYD